MSHLMLNQACVQQIKRLIEDCYPGAVGRLGGTKRVDWRRIGRPFYSLHLHVLEVLATT
jgi:hypothetical protein